jgi:cell division protein FtsN
MAARRGGGRSAGARRVPGWLLLLLGLALGASVVLMTQLIMNRAGSKDGVAGLFTRTSKPQERPTPKPEAVPAKPKLDFYTVLPEVETVLPDRNPKTKSPKVERPEEGARYVLQAGAFASFEDADQLKAKLALQGLQAQIQKVTVEGRGEFHRVRLGPYDRIEDLDTVNQQLGKMGIKPIRLKVKRSAG